MFKVKSTWHGCKNIKGGGDKICQSLYGNKAKLTSSRKGNCLGNIGVANYVSGECSAEYNDDELEKCIVEDKYGKDTNCHPAIVSNDYKEGAYQTLISSSIEKGKDPKNIKFVDSYIGGPGKNFYNNMMNYYCDKDPSAVNNKLCYEYCKNPQICPNQMMGFCSKKLSMTWSKECISSKNRVASEIKDAKYQLSFQSDRNAFMENEFNLCTKGGIEKIYGTKCDEKTVKIPVKGPHGIGKTITKKYNCKDNILLKTINYKPLGLTDERCYNSSMNKYLPQNIKRKWDNEWKKYCEKVHNDPNSTSKDLDRCSCFLPEEELMKKYNRGPECITKCKAFETTGAYQPYSVQNAIGSCPNLCVQTINVESGHISILKNIKLIQQCFSGEESSKIKNKIKDTISGDLGDALTWFRDAAFVISYEIDQRLKEKISDKTIDIQKHYSSINEWEWLIKDENLTVLKTLKSQIFESLRDSEPVLIELYGIDFSNKNTDDTKNKYSNKLKISIQNCTSIKALYDGLLEEIDLIINNLTKYKNKRSQLLNHAYIAHDKFKENFPDDDMVGEMDERISTLSKAHIKLDELEASINVIISEIDDRSKELNEKKSRDLLEKEKNDTITSIKAEFAKYLTMEMDKNKYDELKKRFADAIKNNSDLSVFTSIDNELKSYLQDTSFEKRKRKEDYHEKKDVDVHDNKWIYILIIIVIILVIGYFLLK
jgi:hypothetical protein